MAEYQREKDKIIFKEGYSEKREKNVRFLNSVVYSYDNSPTKVRIEVSNRNSNPNAPDNKKWILILQERIQQRVATDVPAENTTDCKISNWPHSYRSDNPLYLYKINANSRRN